MSISLQMKRYLGSPWVLAHIDSKAWLDPYFCGYYIEASVTSDFTEVEQHVYNPTDWPNLPELPLFIYCRNAPPLFWRVKVMERTGKHSEWSNIAEVTAI